MPGEPAHVAIGVSEVEQIAALGWRGLEEAHLGDWLLRAADGFTGRANSALVLGSPRRGGQPQGNAWLADRGSLTDPGQPTAPEEREDVGWLTDLVDWYAERGLPPMAQIPLPGGEAVDAVLAGAGWRSHDLVRFLTGDITEVQHLAAQSAQFPTEGPPVSNLLVQGGPQSFAARVHFRLDAEPDEAWLAAYQYRGAALPGHAREVLQRAGPGTELCFASLRGLAETGASGDVLAVARGALGRAWLGITAVTVSTENRRRGYGIRLMSQLAAWAVERGATAIYLQVAADNHPALGLYQRLGFHHHHDYRYRVGPAFPELS